MLLSGFPTSATTDVDSQLAAYLIGSEGCSTEAMFNAMKAYVKKEVKRDTHTFAPSAAEYGDECRRQEALIRYASHPRLPAPEPIQSIPVEPWKMDIWRKAVVRGDRQSFDKLRRMFPNNPIIANAEFREKEKDNGK